MALPGHMSGKQELTGNWTRCSPHRSYDTLEPNEQHCCREVDRLVRLIKVTLGCLARTEERKIRALEIKLHEV
jgi:hypothetical protein